MWQWVVSMVWTYRILFLSVFVCRKFFCKGYLRYGLTQGLVINPAVGCHYFPPGPMVTFRRASLPLGWYQITLVGDGGTEVLVVCPRPLHGSAWSQLTAATCESQVRCHTDSATLSQSKIANQTTKFLQSFVTCNMIYIQCLKKNCANLFLSELRQIYINFNNIWQKDGKEAKIVRDALIFHLT